jgi:hypothetical protein
MMLRKEDELQALVDEKQQQRMQREREEKQRLRDKLSGKQTESGANSTNHQRSQGADKSGSQ